MYVNSFIRQWDPPWPGSISLDEVIQACRLGLYYSLIGLCRAGSQQHHEGCPGPSSGAWSAVFLPNAFCTELGVQ